MQAQLELGELRLAEDRRLDAFEQVAEQRQPRRRVVDLLKDAGVDMTTDEPLDLTIKLMNRIMDEMETLIAKRK